MDYEKALSFVENSFLKNLFSVDTITDVSYNGEAFFYLDNYKGRKKANVQASKNEVKDFIRQISFLSEQQFSYQHPKLDVSIGRYRINAVHSSIGRIGNEEALTFSIRIASYIPRITRYNRFMSDELVSLFDVLLRSRCSIAIGGVTGSGKTEFQKYLLRNLEANSRVIIIDNILELEQVRVNNKADITTWQVEEKNPNASIKELVKIALRSNPDWLVIAESRGEEMLDLLNSMMTGHPIITTLHAQDIEGMIPRMIRMVMMNEKKMNYEDVKADLLYHMHFLVYLDHSIDENGVSKRFISEINYVDSEGNACPIYRYENGKHIYKKLPKNSIKHLKIKENDDFFINTFIGQEDINE